MRGRVIAAQMPVIHVDEVRIGQEVRLVFSALPSRTTPELVGHVTLVSADALMDERSVVPYYRTGIGIDPEELKRLDRAVLVPGMPAEAFIRTEDRTPLSYLLKPFTDYFSHALRET